MEYPPLLRLHDSTTPRFHDFTTRRLHDPPNCPSCHSATLDLETPLQMPGNAQLISDIEALLAAAKSYDADQSDRPARLDLLGRIEALHYQLEDPAEAMFRQITNVRCGGKSSFLYACGLVPCLTGSSCAVHPDRGGTSAASDGSAGEDPTQWKHHRQGAGLWQRNE